ncbi:MAG: ATP-binding protein [Spirulinaceae cyanobacterium]
MWDYLKEIFSPSQYMPHGNCYLWQPPLVLLHLVSDLLIAYAYFSIPILLIYFVSKRQDVPFMRIFYLFGAFIILCGIGHLLEVWTLWHPAYWLSGIEQGMTALVSCYTAFRMTTLLPQFLSLKTPQELEEINRELAKQIEIGEAARKEQQKAEQILKNVVEGTASATGEEFFLALVENLAKALDIRYAFVAQVVDTKAEKLASLAFWAEKEMGENFEYGLAGTPCEPIFRSGKPCYYPQGVQKLFPEATGLKAMGAQSYLGVPLLDGNQEIIGTLCINNNAPLADPETAEAIMLIFAARAAAELQRQAAELALRQAYDELDIRVQERTADLVKANHTLETEIEERIAAESALKEVESRLRRQQAGLVELATSENLYTGEINAAIAQITQLASRVLDVERTSVWFFNDDQSAIDCVDLYEKSLHHHSEGQKITLADCPNYFQALEQARVIAADDVYQDFRLTDFHDFYFKPLNIVSMLDVAIFLKGEKIGVVCLEHTGAEGRNWTIGEQNFVSYLAYMAALAVESHYRKLAEEALQHKNEELTFTLQQLKTTQDELVQSEKMAALGQLIAGVAHEINTPLGAIRASSSNTANALEAALEKIPQLNEKLSSQQQTNFFALVDHAWHSHLQMSSKEKRQLKRTLTTQLQATEINEPRRMADTLIDMGVGEDIDRFLPLLQESEADWTLDLAYNLVRLKSNSRNIITAVERASKIVFALKSYARYDQSGQKKQIKITDNIETVLELYYNQLKRGVEVIQEYDAQSLPLIWCYPDELVQVWTNLIHNAIQAMEGQGKLTIGVVEQAGELVVKVSDSGSGISPEIQQRIFEPFFTTKPIGEGSGLGLDIVRKIIDKHQGRIEVNSQPGETTFSVFLPS